MDPRAPALLISLAILGCTPGSSSGDAADPPSDPDGLEHRAASPWVAPGLAGSQTDGDPSLDPITDPLQRSPTVLQTPHPPCDEPALGVGQLVDILPSSGVDFVHDQEPGQADLDELADALSLSFGGGVVAADLDRDGNPDLLFTQYVGEDRLYWGDGAGGFEVDGSGAVAFGGELHYAASAADFDGDGLLDLLLLGMDTLHLLHNRGDREFVDVTDEAGLVPSGGMALTSAWADWDRDGDLDLYIGWFPTDEPHTDPLTGDDQLWRNDGGSFSPMPEALPVPGAADGNVLHAVWRDFDGDGDPDLLQLNDGGTNVVNSFLWENLGSSAGEHAWVDRLDDSGIGVLGSPMGASVVDLDEDGKRDLWISRRGRNQIFNGTPEPWLFTDVGLLWGDPLPSTRDDHSWSVLDLDLAGDGRPGVLVTYGPLPTYFWEEYLPADQYAAQPDRFLAPLDTASGRRWEEAPSVFPEPQTGSSRGAARADFDRDGVPDLVIGNVDGPPALYLGRCTDAHRLVVELEDPDSANPFAVGAVVHVEAADRSWTREVAAGGGGAFSSEDPVLFFGLGEAETVDRIQVRWPDGQLDQVLGACGHCRVRITRP